MTKREFFHKHLGYYRELQEEHLDKLYRLIQEDYPRQVAEYAAVPETADTSDAPPPKDAEEDISTTSTQSGDEDDANDDNLPSDDEREDEREEKEAVEESTDRDDAGGAGDGVTSCKRFRWSDAMRDELFTIITVENAMSEIRNEKLKLENSPESYSEINARKALYKRVRVFAHARLPTSFLTRLGFIPPKFRASMGWPRNDAIDWTRWSWTARSYLDRRHALPNGTGARPTWSRSPCVTGGSCTLASCLREHSTWKPGSSWNTKDYVFMCQRGTRTAWRRARRAGERHIYAPRPA